MCMCIHVMGEFACVHACLCVSGCAHVCKDGYESMDTHMREREREREREGGREGERERDRESVCVCRGGGGGRRGGA